MIEYYLTSVSAFHFLKTFAAYKGLIPKYCWRLTFVNLTLYKSLSCPSSILFPPSKTFKLCNMWIVASEIGSLKQVNLVITTFWMGAWDLNHVENCFANSPCFFWKSGFLVRFCQRSSPSDCFQALKLLDSIWIYTLDPTLWLLKCTKHASSPLFEGPQVR